VTSRPDFLSLALQDRFHAISGSGLRVEAGLAEMNNLGAVEGANACPVLAMSAKLSQRLFERAVAQACHAPACMMESMRSVGC